MTTQPHKVHVCHSPLPKDTAMPPSSEVPSHPPHPSPNCAPSLQQGTGLSLCSTLDQTVSPFSLKAYGQIQCYSQGEDNWRWEFHTCFSTQSCCCGTRISQAGAGSSLSRRTVGQSIPFGTHEWRQALGALSWRFSHSRKQTSLISWEKDVKSSHTGYREFFFQLWREIIPLQCSQVLSAEELIKDKIATVCWSLTACKTPPFSLDLCSTEFCLLL